MIWVYQEGDPGENVNSRGRWRDFEWRLAASPAEKACASTHGAANICPNPGGELRLKLHDAPASNRFRLTTTGATTSVILHSRKPRRQTAMPSRQRATISRQSIITDRCPPTLKKLRNQTPTLREPERLQRRPAGRYSSKYSPSLRPARHTARKSAAGPGDLSPPKTSARLSKALIQQPTGNLISFLKGCQSRAPGGSAPHFG